MMFFCFYAYSGESFDIREGDFINPYGVFDLYENPDFRTRPWGRTVNHEGGIRFVVLKSGETEMYENEVGKWYYVCLVSDMWIDSMELVRKNKSFWIFIQDGKVDLHAERNAF